MKRVLLIVNLLLQIPLLSQIKGPTDTISIYENKAGMPFRKYYYFWFENRRNSFDYSLKNKQDSLVANDTTAKYLYVFDHKNRLLLKGTKNKSGRFTGEVRWYYKSGKIKRVENWGEGRECEDTCTNKFYFFDGMVPQRKWSYYRKDGTLAHETEFVFQGSCERKSPEIIRKITFYSAKGVKRRTKSRRTTFY